MDAVEVEIEASKGWERTTFASRQPEYLPLPALRCDDGRVVTRWRPSAEEMAALLEGHDIFVTLMTFNTPLQPILITVGGANVEPLE